MLVIGVLVPAVIVGVLVGALGVSALFTGALWGALGAKLGGTRWTAYGAPAVGVAAGLGSYTTYDWWWAGLLAATGLLSGLGFRFGWFPVLFMAPFAATFVTPTSAVGDAAIFGTVVAVGTGYGVVVVRRFGVPPIVEGDRYSWPVAAVIALAFGGVMGVAAGLGVALSWSEPYWVPALALLALLAALMQRQIYWRMYGVYTLALVLYIATPGDVAFVAEQRGLQILAGIGLLALGLLAVHAVADRLAQRYPQPELAAVPPT